VTEVIEDFFEGSKSFVEGWCLVFLANISGCSVFVNFCNTPLKKCAQHAGSDWIFDIGNKTDIQETAYSLFQSLKL
jgi:hypothetical protein